ncbi:MAG: hypothetical protein ABR956_01495 [Terracidiphilus sp.]|jgi:hypothetical protein
MDEFEREMRHALERRPAPPGLKRRLMKRRGAQRTHRPSGLWRRLAACLALVSVAAGGALWRNAEQRRKGEAARQQVMTALRITGHALGEMNKQMAAHGRDE